jgi:hypothetical protein
MGEKVMARENSKYENQQAEDNLWEGYTMLSYLIVWPLSFLILLIFNDVVNILPWWAWITLFPMFLLLFPLFVGSKLNRLHIESGTPVPGKDN